MIEDTALVLVGHGSHRNAGSARPVYDHADEIRARDRFAEVREAFWKEAPSLREVLRTVESTDVVVVPLFTSEGYFTEQVLPRELRLTDEWDLDVDKRVRYADPVGTHESMADVIVERAEHVTDDPSVGDGVGLAVVGHGTERNPRSAKATRDHVAGLEARERFDEVRALFMDQAPYIDDLTDHFESDELVVVPLFVADGYHTQEDIPEDIGLTDDAESGYPVPADVDGKRVWYSGAVGTEPLVADVVIERARATLDDGDEPVETTEQAADAERSEAETARDAFLGWLADGGSDEHHDATRTWGQLAITTTRTADGSRRYEIRHVEDRDEELDELDSHADPAETRDRVRFTDDGEYRPLATASTLPTGWVLSDLDAADLLRAVEFVYPATISNWYRERNGELDVSHFRETAERQTGVYADVGDIGREALDHAVEACCVDSQCSARREWDAADDDEIAVPRGDGEFPCREPCSLFIAKVREFQKMEECGEDDAEDGYRARYRSARRGGRT
ncbi:DR2241 family protein [Haladaptatus sp. AB643]|nr:DR2241 family protein [Haladaptatus sp. AB643]MCO8246501.1 DR2241 family protein [Haladaptatus sp. AB643]